MAIKFKFNPHTPAPWLIATKECLSLREVALLLGISEPTILKNLDQIPHRRIGKGRGRLLFGRQALLKWLNLEEESAEQDAKEQEEENTDNV